MLTPEEIQAIRERVEAAHKITSSVIDRELSRAILEVSLDDIPALLKDREAQAKRIEELEGALKPFVKVADLEIRAGENVKPEDIILWRRSMNDPSKDTFITVADMNNARTAALGEAALTKQSAGRRLNRMVGR